MVGHDTISKQWQDGWERLRRRFGGRCAIWDSCVEGTALVGDALSRAMTKRCRPPRASAANVLRWRLLPDEVSAT